MSDFQNFIEDRVGVATFRLAPIPDVVDQSGRDRDDYESLMRLQVLESLSHLEGQTKKPVDKHRWVTTILKNKTTDCRRELCTAKAKLVDVEDKGSLPDPGAIDLGVHLERRELLTRLRTVLSVEDWTILLLLAEHGMVRDTWRASGLSINERAFGRRLQRIIEFSRDFLQKISD